jgi:hypothetical protein
VLSRLQTNKISRKTMQNLLQRDGGRKTFQLWWMRYKSYAAMQGWAFALKESFEKVLPSAEDDAWDTLPPA